MISPPSSLPSPVGLQDQETGAVTPTRDGLTLRSVVLCLALAVGFGYLIPIIDMKMRNTFLGATHLPPGAVGVLLIVLLLINPASRAFAARQNARFLLLGAAVVLGALAVATRLLGGPQLSGWAVPGFWLAVAASGMALLVFCLGSKPLTRNESLTVYISCLFSCLTPGHGAENVFVVNLIGPFYYATRENRWLEFLEPYLAPWMTPALAGGKGYGDLNQVVVSNWFIGARDAQVPWGAWLVPLLIWGFFIGVLYAMMACLCVMLRKQWAEREALAFPLLRLPLELTKDMDEPQTGLFSSFFHSPMMWSGFGIAVVIQALRGLNLYFPDVPTVPLDINTGTAFLRSAMESDRSASDGRVACHRRHFLPVNHRDFFFVLVFLLVSEVSDDPGLLRRLYAERLARRGGQHGRWRQNFHVLSADRRLSGLCGSCVVDWA
jgi:hypothetical protein